MFTSRHSHNAFEDAVARIAGIIRARLLSPGDRLPPERHLAGQLGISRSTLRECLHTLCDAGLLKTRSGRQGGTFVARWPGTPSRGKRLSGEEKDQLIAQLDLRRALEPMAAELAASRASLIQIAELEGRYYSMVGVENSFELYRARDVRFHVGIAQVCANPLLLQSVTDVHLALTEALDLITYHAKHLAHRSNEDHGRILEAIRHRRPNEARQLMTNHILRAEKLLYAFNGWF